MSLGNRKPMTRTSFNRKPAATSKAPAAEPKPFPGPRKRKCTICKTPYEPRSAWAKVCGPDCAEKHAAAVLVKQRAKAQREERAKDKVKRESMKSIPQLKEEVQKVFNLYIRLRDAGKPCICCGKFATAAALAKLGGAYDACHWRSRGSADHLRYNEDNVHLGLKDCNTWGHLDYRGGLIKRIGLERVEALESNQAIVKWTHDGLRELKKHYQRLVRELKKEQQS